MSELAHETLERHEHLAHAPADQHGRRAALLIGVLAAILALSEMAERGAQNAYLAHHISATDTYAFYQARQTRALVLAQSAMILDALPGSGPAATAARAEASRLTADGPHGNGEGQLQARAAAEAAARDAALHRNEWFEIVTSALQIAIVLASVSVVTHIRVVAYVGAGLGVVASVLAGLILIGAV